jgi:hypothetical protein
MADNDARATSIFDADVLGALAQVLGSLADRQAELLGCLRDIRRARNLEDLGIDVVPPGGSPLPAAALAHQSSAAILRGSVGARAAPATQAGLTVSATEAVLTPAAVRVSVAAPTVMTPAVAQTDATPPGGSPTGGASHWWKSTPAAVPATRRDYDYFAELERRIAELSDGR